MKVNEIITNRFIEMIKKGVNPFKLPFKKKGMPKNFITGREYNGINIWLLSFNQFESNSFLTMNQANKLGYRVKKGSESQIAIFWDILKYPSEGEKKEKTIPYLKYYHLFNVQQLEGFTIPKDEKPILNNCETYKNAKSIIKEYHKRIPFTLKFGGDRACFLPFENKIMLPLMSSFKDQNSFFQVLFHELSHQTQIPLKRETETNKLINLQDYSFEELIAELSSSFILNHLGFEQDLNNSASYLSGWLEPLEKDPNFIIRASAKAQKAYNLILNIQEGKENENDN